MLKKFVYVEGVTKKYEVLKEAMRYLSPVTVDIPTERSTKFEFICQCINKVVNDKPLLLIDTSGIVTEIENRLGGESTLNAWLWHTHKIAYDDQGANQGRKMQSTRLAWMQSMYSEFKAKDE